MKEDIPKPTMRQNSFLKVIKKTLNVSDVFSFTSSIDVSIITIPINGKTKNTIPKIGVT